MTTKSGLSQARTITLKESKTVAELLEELELSIDHVVIADGSRLSLDSIIHENDVVVVLPLIAGG